MEIFRETACTWVGERRRARCIQSSISGSSLLVRSAPSHGSVSHHARVTWWPKLSLMVIARCGGGRGMRRRQGHAQDKLRRRDYGSRCCRGPLR